MKKLMILSGVALLGLADSVVAQPAGDGPRRGGDVTRAEVIQRTDAAFARLDANGDGRFTREEAQARGQQRREQMRTRMFERLDADNDGQISREEFAQARHGRGMRGPRAGAGPDGHGGPGMRRGWRHGPGMRMGMGARLFGEAGDRAARREIGLGLPVVSGDDRGVHAHLSGARRRGGRCDRARAPRR